LVFSFISNILGDGDKMAVAETAVIPRTYISPQRLEQIRSKLRQKMREFWDSPEGQALALALSAAAYNAGWDKVMSEFWTKDKRDYLSDRAKEVGLGAKYKVIWGKPLKPEEYTEAYR
jgi:hypothetical protein